MTKVPVIARTAVVVLMLCGCERELRPYTTGAPFVAARAASAAGASSAARAASAALGVDPDQNAWAVAQGKRWYRWYNCNGCHGSGGGNMGPALMDATWRYGSEPHQIVDTILQGRPNGMPGFAPRMPVEHAAQLAAYVRSMSGQLRTDVAPSRGDTISTGQPENRRDRVEPIPGDPPPEPR